MTLLKWLLHFLEVGQVTDITANALSSGTEGADRVSDTEINLHPTLVQEIIFPVRQIGFLTLRV